MQCACNFVIPRRARGGELPICSGGEFYAFFFFLLFCGEIVVCCEMVGWRDDGGAGMSVGCLPAIDGGTYVDTHTVVVYFGSTTVVHRFLLLLLPFGRLRFPPGSSRDGMSVVLLLFTDLCLNALGIVFALSSNLSCFSYTKYPLSPSG